MARAGKAQFVPAFLEVLNHGFKCHRGRVADEASAQGPEDDALDALLKSGRAKVTVDAHQELVRDLGEAHEAVFGVVSPKHKMYGGGSGAKSTEVDANAEAKK